MIWAILGIYMLISLIISGFSILMVAIAEGKFDSDAVKTGFACGFLTPLIFLPSIIMSYFL